MAQMMLPPEDGKVLELIHSYPVTAVYATVVSTALLVSAILDVML